jgi:hypothetical protein
MAHRTAFFRTFLVVCLLPVSGVIWSQANLVEFPYNPDADGDDFVGTSDLLSLLSIYGSEFSEEGLYLNEDTTEAVLYIGPRSLMDCVSECKQLPGNWGLPTLSQFPLVHEIVSADNYNFVLEVGGGSNWHYQVPIWTKIASHPKVLEFDIASNGVILNESIPDGSFSAYSIVKDLVYYPLSTTSNIFSPAINPDFQCFCAITQRPRVEYALCTEVNEALFNQCISEKLNSGWYPSGGTSRSQSGNYSFLTQSFWRWAE